MTKLTDLIPDPNNANKGTERGRGMLEKSLQELGAGRSILVDKNGVTIAGAKTLEAAVESGFEDAIVVQSDGSQLVVVQRTDLDLGKDSKAKKLAIADNRVGEISLDWDGDVLKDLGESIDLSGFFSEKELDKLIEPKGEGQGKGKGDRKTVTCPACGEVIELDVVMTSK